jgi:Spy/CpxP family protein refolding chaperone
MRIFNRFITLLAVTLMALSLSVFAQNEQGNMSSTPEAHQGHGKMPSADDRLEHLSQTLNLSDDQKAKIKPMLEDESSKMQALWQDNSTPREQKRPKMQQIRQDTAEQIKTVLNPDQQKKFADMQGRMKQHIGERHGGDDNSNQNNQ